MAKQNNTENNMTPAPAQDNAPGLKTPGRLPVVFPWGLLPALIALLVYANTLSNDFALDDYLVIKENTIVSKGIAGIPELLTTSYHSGFNRASNELYRPLSLIVFATVKQFAGFNATAFHAVNVLAFACCVIALFLFLHHLFERKKIVVAFIASLLFALHPIHTEVVANCKGLDDLLCFLFAFLSLHAFVGYSERGKRVRLLAGAGFFLLSFMAKETAITFLAVVPLIFFMYRNEHRDRSIHITLSVAIAAAVLLIIRYTVLHDSAHPPAAPGFLDNPLTQAGLSFESRMATAVLIAGYYLRLLLLPHPLVCDYSYNTIPFAHFTDIGVLASLAVYILLIGLAVKLLLANRKNPYAFALSFFLITLSLFSNIFFLIGANMAERFLFFPSVGFCLAIALLIDKAVVTDSSNIALLKSPKLLGLLAAISIAYGALAANRNTEWQDNTTLFTADAAKAPNDARLNFFLGNELTMGNIPMGAQPPATFKEGLGYLQKAIAIYPQYIEAHVELGRAYFEAQDLNKAVQYEQRALELEPGNLQAKNFLGSVYLAAKQYNEAIALYHQVLARDPDNIFAHFNLGACYANTKDYPAAINELNNTIALDPAYGQYKAFEYLVRIYKKTGREDSARLYENMMMKYKNE